MPLRHRPPGARQVAPARDRECRIAGGADDVGDAAAGQRDDVGAQRRLHRRHGDADHAAHADAERAEPLRIHRRLRREPPDGEPIGAHRLPQHLLNVGGAALRGEVNRRATNQHRVEPVVGKEAAEGALDRIRSAEDRPDEDRRAAPRLSRAIALDLHRRRLRQRQAHRLDPVGRVLLSVGQRLGGRRRRRHGVALGDRRRQRRGDRHGPARRHMRAAGW